MHVKNSIDNFPDQYLHKASESAHNKDYFPNKYIRAFQFQIEGENYTEKVNSCRRILLWPGPSATVVAI